MKSRLTKIYAWLVCLMPAALFLSYHPVISLGGNETMNFELSVALAWLVIFDVVSAVVAVREKLVAVIWLEGGWQKWLWLAFPIFATVSVMWSLNKTRGFLTAGVLWLVVFAVISLVMILPKIVDAKEFRARFLKWFFGASAVACVWCVVQCVLDLAGVPQEMSLLCDGCVTEMFGFPHPNGMAIEPQFMGNLLLAPAILSGYLLIKKFDKKLLILNFVFVSTLLLTFSRGAIYAFVVAMIFLTVFEIVRMKKWRAMLVWPVIAAAFVVTLCAQGVMAEVSPTNDTFQTGVAKVLNQMSLGVIDVRVETPAENVDAEEAEKSEAVFDGYVAESTDTRVRLTNAAVTIWQKGFKTATIGVGLGGAGQALYNNNLSPAPKEIVQNEYASVLLEMGVVGLVLFILLIVLVVRVFIKSPANGMLLALLIAYGITLCFFSGLANALQIYLMLAAVYILFYNSKRKKLVS